MIKNSKIDVDDTNLIELMLIVWRGKWKITLAVVISFIVMISYQLFQKKNFIATTEIKYITSLERGKYFAFNIATSNIKFSDQISILDKLAIDRKMFDRSELEETLSKNYFYEPITSTKLLNMYINILRDKLVFEDAIRKFNLLNPSQYDSEEEYSEAITRLADTVKILPPLTNNKNNISYHTISFKYDDLKKWKNALKYVDRVTHAIVKETLVKDYQNTIAMLKRINDDKVEDISIKIENLIFDYERTISDRISYLREQSEIAKQLGIAKNTFEVQSFGTQNTLLSNVKTDSPFYLRGYEAINKEIELSMNRSNKNAFIEGLFELEKQRRSIIQNKSLDRVNNVFQSTPLSMDNKKFSAVLVNFDATKVEYKNYKNSILLTMVIGLIFGLFYVIISSTVQLLKSNEKKN